MTRPLTPEELRLTRGIFKDLDPDKIFIEKLSLAAQQLLDAVDTQQKNGLGLTGAVCVAWIQLDEILNPGKHMPGCS